MPTPTRSRLRLLRQAVADNVVLARGLPPRRPRRLTGWLVGLGGVVLLAGGVALAATLLGAGRAAPGAATPAGSEPASAATASAPARPDLSGVAVHEPWRGFDPAALPLDVRRIVIDPGHGGRDVGALGPGGMHEKELTLDLAQRLDARLRAGGFETVLTRDDDRSRPLLERTRLANEAGGDLFVSIHVNWLEKRAACGLETYYLGPSDDPAVTRLAAIENTDSGYSLADMRRLIDGIYADFRQGEAKRFGVALHGSLLETLQRFNPELEDRGVRSAPFLVLVGAEMPAVLAEVSCLSSRAEAELLREAVYRQEIAAALFRGIVAYAVGDGDA